MEAEDKFTTELISTSPQLNELLAALSVAQSSVKKAARNGYNKHLNYYYSELEDCWDVARPVLKETGLSITHFAVTVDDQAGVVQFLGHSSGQWIKSLTLLILGNSKNMVHACGSNFTYARRYALCGTLGITTGEDNDGEPGHKPPHPSEDPKMRALVDKQFHNKVKDRQDRGICADRVREVLKQGGYSRLSEIPLKQRDEFLRLISIKPSNEPAPLL